MITRITLKGDIALMVCRKRPEDGSLEESPVPGTDLSLVYGRRSQCAPYYAEAYRRTRSQLQEALWTPRKETCRRGTARDDA